MGRPRRSRSKQRSIRESVGNEKNIAKDRHKRHVIINCNHVVKQDGNISTEIRNHNQNIGEVKAADESLLDLEQRMRQVDMKDIVKSCLVTSHLNRVLKDPSSRDMFAKFLNEVPGGSDRNVHFWIDCEKYANMEHCKERAELARIIVKRYLVKNAAEKIHFDDDTVKEIKDGIATETDDQNQKLFASVQRRVFNQMKTGSFSRFLESDSYKQLAEQEKEVGVVSEVTPNQYLTCMTK